MSATKSNFNVFQTNLAKYFNGEHTEFTMLADELTKLNVLTKKCSEAYAKVTDTVTK